MPQWGQQVPRRKPLPGNYYPPRTEETRRMRPARQQQQQQQRHAKPTAPAFPPTVNTRRREDTLGVGSSSGGAAHATSPARERRRRDRRQQQQKQPQQLSSRRGPRSPTSAASVQPTNPPKGRAKANKAKDTPRDSACDVSRPGGSSRGNSDGISWADPPVSLPLRQHTLLDDEEDDLYLDAAAAALGRKLDRYPVNNKDGGVERAVVRASFFMASEQLRARAERQLQRQQLRQQQQQRQEQQQRQQRETERTRYEANMEAAALALERILESTQDSLTPTHVGGARPVPAQSPATANGQQQQQQQQQQRGESSISSMRSGGEYAPRPKAESRVTREMELLMAHVNQEMEDHEREVRAGTYAPHRARGGQR